MSYIQFTLSEGFTHGGFPQGHGIRGFQQTPSIYMRTFALKGPLKWITPNETVTDLCNLKPPFSAKGTAQVNTPNAIGIHAVCPETSRSYRRNDSSHKDTAVSHRLCEEFLASCEVASQNHSLSLSLSLSLSGI